MSIVLAESVLAWTAAQRDCQHRLQNNHLGQWQATQTTQVGQTIHVVRKGQTLQETRAGQLAIQGSYRKVKRNLTQLFAARVCS